GEPIPPDEMREQVDETVERIRSLRPRRILEIGCGTGLLLFRLAPDCDRYVGTDFSTIALKRRDSSPTRVGLRKLNYSSGQQMTSATSRRAASTWSSSTRWSSTFPMWTICEGCLKGRFGWWLRVATSSWAMCAV